MDRLLKTSYSWQFYTYVFGSVWNSFDIAAIC